MRGRTDAGGNHAYSRGKHPLCFERGSFAQHGQINAIDIRWVRIVSDHLHHKLAVLHQSLLHGKLPRSLHWSDALELIEHLGTAQPTGGGDFTFVVGTQRECFKQPHTPELGTDEVSRLRRFLKGAASESPAIAPAQAGRMIVVIDHHAAHIFRDVGGSRPGSEATIEPYDPHHFRRHLVHRKEAHYQGDRAPEETSYYEEVAAALAPATGIILIGHGTGKSSALDALVAYLKKHRPEVSRRVTATGTADLSALTEPEVEAIARRFSASAPSQQ